MTTFLTASGSLSQSPAIIVSLMCFSKIVYFEVGDRNHSATGEGRVSFIEWSCISGPLCPLKRP